jgi:probable H4MPT-linked C1 transfer pathway protein
VIEADSSLALDIGGANIKAAHSSGRGVSRAFALWKRPADLSIVLAEVAREFPPATHLLVTMTAELCDCFRTRREGVIHVLHALASALPGLPIQVWCLDGRFHPVESVLLGPLLAASSNWLALATVVARMVGPGVSLLIDIGSTTSDLIPLRDGEVVVAGRTDAERLGSGELVYAGVRRTAVSALADRLPYRGRDTRLAAELFATTLDVTLVRGETLENPLDLDTADGRAATIANARARLARMVGTDVEGFTDDDAKLLADAADEALVARLMEAADQACVQRWGKPSTLVVSGSGEFLASRVAHRLGSGAGRVLSLANLWGRGPSEWACAQALLVLAGERAG